MNRRLLLLALLAAPAVGSAQDRRVTALLCAHVAQPDYGFETIDCVNCEITARGQSWIVFHSQPVVRGVRGDGPAAGRLVDGDTLLAIDGLVITTPQAARRYAGAAVGDTVEFRVRRGATTVTARIAVGQQCGAAGRTFTWYTHPHAPQLRLYFNATVDTVLKRVRFNTDVRFDTLRTRFRSDSAVLWFARDSVRWRVEVPKVNAALLKAPIRFSYNLTPAFRRAVTFADSAAMTPGWIGIAMFRMLRSPDQLRSQDLAGAVFTELPEIAAVAPGSPADSAGIVPGDTLWAVDGISILTAEGARRFLDAPVGVAMYLLVRRAGAMVRVRVVPKEAPVEPPAAVPVRQPRD